MDIYCGSLFLGHCDANFCDFGEKMNWRIEYLLQIMTDEPRTNLSFNKKLADDLKNKNGKSIINVGTCTLHKFNNGYKKALQKLSFDFDYFSTDIHLFFKNSSARRYDLQLMDLITGIEAAFMFKHVSSRWHSLKNISTEFLSSGTTFENIS